MLTITFRPGEAARFTAPGVQFTVRLELSKDRVVAVFDLPQTVQVGRLGEREAAGHFARAAAKRKRGGACR